MIALLLLALAGAGADAGGARQRQAVVFEPCPGLLGDPLAHGALERIAAERSFALERLRPGGDVGAWLSLLADPPAALYLHTVTNHEMIAVACFGGSFNSSRRPATSASTLNSVVNRVPARPRTPACSTVSSTWAQGHK